MAAAPRGAAAGILGPMYETHFGISAPPFQLSPDPSFYFDSRAHHETLDAVRQALAHAAGHVIVSGEIGAGKTLLVGTLVAELDPQQILVGRLVSTQLDADGLLRASLNAFGAERRRIDRGTDLLAAIDAFLVRLAEAGKRAGLFIDVAQNLDAGAWQRLAELDAGASAPRGTLTLFLVGQPELRSILAHERHAALYARIAVQRHLGPLGAFETGAYIAHRLDHVGWSGKPAFDAEALNQIHRWTGGVPRRINQLSNRLMLAAFLEGLDHIDRTLVDTVAQELRAELGESTLVPLTPALPPPPPPPPAAQAKPAAPARPAAPAPGAAAAPTLPMASTPAALPLAATGNETAPGESLSLKLLPLDDVAPDKSTLVPQGLPAARVRFPSFAPWPSLPPVPQQLPPVLHDAVESAGRGPLLCVAGGPSDHVQAAALLRALAVQRELPPARLVRAFANEQLQRCGGMFRSIDAERALALGVTPSGTYADRASELMARFDAVLEQHRPTAVIVFDGHEAALAAGLVASRRGVQLLRVGAGRRGAESAGSVALTRKLSDLVADMLYTADPATTAQLIADGLPTARISTVGSVFADALQLALRDGLLSDDADALPALVAQVATERAGSAVVSLESRSHIQDKRTLTELVNLLAAVSRDIALVWPMRDATREQLLHLRLDPVIDRARIVCLPLQPYPAFAQLLADATCVLTDSWTLQEEATALELPCLTIGTEAAHPLTLQQGSNIFVGMDRIAATRAVWQCVFGGGRAGAPPRMWDGRACERIATHLTGYLTRVRPAGA